MGTIDTALSTYQVKTENSYFIFNSRDAIVFQYLQADPLWPPFKGGKEAGGK